MEISDEALKSIGKILTSRTIKEIMSSPAITVNVNEDFSRVEEMFVNKNIRHLPVLEAGQLVGIITQKDLYKMVSPRKVFGQIDFQKDMIVDGEFVYSKELLDKYILNHVMRKNPLSLGSEATIGEAVHILVSSKISCVPIVDNSKKVIGIVTRYDILKLVDDIFTQALGTK